MFRDISWSAETVTEDGLHHMTMTAVYAARASGRAPGVGERAEREWRDDAAARVMAEKRRLIVVLAIAIIANVLLFALVVFPLGRQVASAEQEAQVQREALRRARQDAASAARDDLRASSRPIRRSASSTRTSFPADASSASGITYPPALTARRAGEPAPRARHQRREAGEGQQPGEGDDDLFPDRTTTATCGTSSTRSRRRRSSWSSRTLRSARPRSVSAA